MPIIALEFIYAYRFRLFTLNDLEIELVTDNNNWPKIIML